MVSSCDIMSVLATHVVGSSSSNGFIYVVSDTTEIYSYKNIIFNHYFGINDNFLASYSYKTAYNLNIFKANF